MQFNRTIRGVVASAAIAGVGVPPGMAQQPSFRAGWVRVQPVRQFSSAAHGKLGSEIMSMSERRWACETGEISTQVHETTHAANARIRGMFGAGINAFFVGQSTAFVLREPKLRLSDVLRYVPAELRGENAGLYLQQQDAHWGSQPLYVLDEHGAYVNAYAAGVEAGNADPGDLQRAIEFQAYATALLLAIEDIDPNYADKDALAEFVGWQLARVCLLSERAKKAGQWRQSHETLSTRFHARFVREEK